MRFCRAAWRDGEAVPERGLGLMWYAIQVETGREDWVRKIDYHRRVAYLDMPMGGRKVAGQAGLRMVSKAKGRLLAKELTKAPTNKE